MDDSTMDPQALQDTIDARIRAFIPLYMKGEGFTDRKITDTPTDALQVVNRKYVTLNGTTRPTSSVVGQSFFDASLASGRGKPITWNGTGWVDATGTYT